MVAVGTAATFVFRRRRHPGIGVLGDAADSDAQTPRALAEPPAAGPREEAPQMLEERSRDPLLDEGLRALGMLSTSMPTSTRLPKANGKAVDRPMLQHPILDTGEVDA